MDRPLRVAVIGAGPAGIYAADHLIKSSETVTVDIFDKLPTPYGLIRYGVAPDHPRIKEIVTALFRILDNPRIRFIGNVAYGVDVKPEELSRFYDATIISTGAEKDRALDIPGIDLQGSYGAADFASWYNGHPDVSREWPLEAREVAVIGAGNVAVDVARILAKTADELLVTEIPDNVYQALKASPVTDVHVFSRRGPAQVKFTPQELRELDHSPNVEVIVHPEGIEFDEGSLEAMRKTRHVKMCVDILQNWAVRDPGTGRAACTCTSCRPPSRCSARTARWSGCGPRRRSSPATAGCAAPASSPTGRCRPCTGLSATSAPPCPTCRSTPRPARSRTMRAGSSTSTASTSPACTWPAGSSAARSA